MHSVVARRDDPLIVHHPELATEQAVADFEKDRSLFLAPAAVRARIGLTYLWRHRRWPNLADALRFTEQVQLRKIHDRDPRMPMLADKVLVKAHVAQGTRR